ncbi:hypothetical protein Tco_0738682 [Tanacetum coccineum]
MAGHAIERRRRSGGDDGELNRSEDEYQFDFMHMRCARATELNDPNGKACFMVLPLAMRYHEPVKNLSSIIFERRVSPACAMISRIRRRS